jgi:hypothetical protein
MPILASTDCGLISSARSKYCRASFRINFSCLVTPWLSCSLLFCSEPTYVTIGGGPPSISNLSTARRHCRRRLSRLGWVRSIARRRQAPGDRLCPIPVSVGLAQRSLAGAACGQHNRNRWAGKHRDTRNQAQYRLQSLQTDARRRPRAAKPLPHVVGAGRLWLVIGTKSPCASRRKRPPPRRSRRKPPNRNTSPAASASMAASPTRVQISGIYHNLEFFSSVS